MRPKDWYERADDAERREMMRLLCRGNEGRPWQKMVQEFHEQGLVLIDLHARGDTVTIYELDGMTYRVTVEGGL